MRSCHKEAGRKLGEAMAGTADSVRADVLASSRGSARDTEETLAAAEQGRFAELTAECWTPDVVYCAGQQ